MAKRLPSEDSVADEESGTLLLNLFIKTYKRKYSPQLDALPAMFGPTPRYNPLMPLAW